MQTLHKYQILEKIGAGGFGVVYKATDPFIKRFVAIKTCTAEDSETRDRFLREAEIAGNLHHRNIVTVYDFGYHEGTPYLVQEYLTGEDLDRKIKRQDFLPMPEKVLYLVQVARGLAYAHEKGVVHRDIKPANIRILEDDTAKIMDFGIAKLAQQQQSLTQAGITLGTAAYLAPEQIRGEPSDSRTDIFSFGSMAYELVAYERPFAGAEISAIFYRILNEEVTPLRQLMPDCPLELERIVLRCLEKSPAKRYAECQLLLHDLEELARRRAAGDRGGRTTATAPSPSIPSPSSQEMSRGIAQERRATLGDIELDAPRAAPPVHSDGLNTFATRSGKRSGGWLGKAVAALALVALGGFGAWRLQQELRAREASAAAGGTESTASAAGEVAPPPAAAVPSGTGATASSPPPAQDSSPVGPAGVPSAAQPEAAIAPEPAPPPPAVLIVAPGWDSSMSVKVGRKSWPLDRERRFELEAGSYKLHFTVQSAVYSHAEDQTVRLESGETRRVTPPIDRPGRLTVQPHLSTPQGYLRLDGQVVGATPLRGRWLAPGAHRIVIATGPDPGASIQVDQSVDVVSEQETILTFDVSGKLPLKTSARPALPN